MKLRSRESADSPKCNETPENSKAFVMAWRALVQHGSLDLRFGNPKSTFWSGRVRLRGPAARRRPRERGAWPPEWHGGDWEFDVRRGRAREGEGSLILKGTTRVTTRASTQGFLLLLAKLRDVPGRFQRVNLKVQGEL